jgi:hypothetical protein
VLLLALAACAGPQALLCAAPQQSAVVVELLFGRNIGNRLGVSEGEWRTFVAREVSPRFPDGLTVADVTGQWRDTERGTIVREPSKIVSVILRDSAGYRDRIDAIVAAYKQRFRQQSVGVVTRPVCVAF